MVEEKKSSRLAPAEFKFIKFGDEQIKNLAEDVSKGAYLGAAEFLLSTGKISDIGVAAIAAILTSDKCPKKMTIYLDVKGINSRWVNVITTALASCKCAQLRLYLRNNQIGDSDVIALTDAASCKWPADLEFNLSNNQIGDAGAIAWANALSSGRCPERFRLLLQNNKIGDEGAIALANALSSGNCPEGLHVNLHSNNIGDKAKTALLTSLESGSCPIRLHLSLDGGKNSFGMVTKALREHKYPEGLHLSFTKGYIQNEIEAFKTALKQARPSIEVKIDAVYRAEDATEIADIVKDRKAKQEKAQQEAALAYATFRLTGQPTFAARHIFSFLPSPFVSTWEKKVCFAKVETLVQSRSGSEKAEANATNVTLSTIVTPKV